ncbi:hypothetical protein Patl1_32589 [Pistacia atlantica]|uniref:Uncharacterized protein n=1 Tax=Pistacia atlantica TaxID=434234 RepID=A0ACC1AM95_9ROSI|nr:hypothetical protein Patl1_32589 [Pistacia atlantica]
MVLVDLRNHAWSVEIEGLALPHDKANAANDLANLVKAKGWAWPDVVIGHSLGSKVALHFAQSCAREQLWVLDTFPGEVRAENSDGGVEILLQFLQSLPSQVPSQKVIQMQVLDGVVIWHNVYLPLGPLEARDPSRWPVNHMIELWIPQNQCQSGSEATSRNLESMKHGPLILKVLQMFNSYL